MIDRDIMYLETNKDDLLEYADDWYCRNCEYGPLNESDDKCPRCNTKWNEDYPSNKTDDYTGEEIEDLSDQLY
jgi:rubrerythrin